MGCTQNMFEDESVQKMNTVRSNMKKEALQCKIIIKIKWCGRKTSSSAKSNCNWTGFFGVDVCVYLCITFCGYVKMYT